MENVTGSALAEEAVRLFRLFFLAARSVDACNSNRPRTNSLHFHVLFMLTNEPPPGLTMSQLAEATIASKQQLSKLIGTMEESGLVRRELNPSNRRQVYVRILPPGQEMVDEMIAEIRTMITQRLAILNEQEKEELFNSLLLFGKLLRKITNLPNNSPLQEDAR